MKGFRVVVYDTKSQDYFYLTEEWHLSPSSILWSFDGKKLYLSVKEHGRIKLFEIPFNRSVSPVPLITQYSLSSTFRVGSDILITQTSLTESHIVQIFDTQHRTLHRILQHQNNTLSRNSVQEFWYEGFQNHSVHGFLHLPESFNRTKKYPLAFLIHGGPQGAWEDAWSTRWNSAVFANAGQGWVVALINPTGSAGYGQEFQNAVRGNWGTKPCLRPS